MKRKERQSRERIADDVAEEAVGAGQGKENIRPPDKASKTDRNDLSSERGEKPNYRDQYRFCAVAIVGSKYTDKSSVTNKWEG